MKTLVSFEHEVLGQISTYCSMVAAHGSFDTLRCAARAEADMSRNVCAFGRVHKGQQDRSQRCHFAADESFY
jgi:hypothetical protein